MPSDERRVARARVKTIDRRRGPAVRFMAWTALTSGVALAVLGVATSVRPTLHPRLSEVGWVLQRLGLDGGDVALVGVALAASGVVLYALRSFSLLLGVDRETGEAIEDLGRATTNQAECIEGLQALVAALRQETAEMHVILREQAHLLKQREENDPAFRIAASLDQLGMRMDRALLDARHALTSELHQLGDRAPHLDEGPLLDGLERVEGTLRELATLTLHFQRALDAAVQPMPPAAEAAEADAAEAEATHPAASWSDLEPRASLERFHLEAECAEEQLEEPERDDVVEATEQLAVAALEAPGEAHGDADGHDRALPPAPELAIEVQLDRSFVDASEEDVPAPLPAERPEGLDLLTRLDSARPLELKRADDAPPLFPDLDLPRE